MERRPSPPRENWQRIVEAQGLVWPTTQLPDGSHVPYWDESVRYEFSDAEIARLEEATETLHEMCVQAARAILLEKYHPLSAFGLPETARDYLLAGFTAGAPSLYGRFDLRYDGVGPPKLLEYNADTPTGVLESAVIQWQWLEDVAPDADQWNSLHERLVRCWQRIGRSPVHFAHSAVESSGEEWMTVAYLRETAVEAGLTTYGLTVEEIGWDETARQFVGVGDEPISTCFKLYPWEDMLAEPFGERVLEFPGATTWIEPAWKAVLSNKALLAVLWQMFPDHEYLLPAYLDGPHGMTSYVRKPLHGREGAAIDVVTPERSFTTAGEYGAEGYVFQQYVELPAFDGSHAVIGAWVVDGAAAGCLIRESDSVVTDYYARAVPHLIRAPRPDTATRRAWLDS
jgi:glutathionylspermidine synthase